MDRLWDSFLEGGLRRRGEGEVEWLPSLDVAETKNELVVKAEVPGMDPKDIDISLSDGVLTIRGEKRQEKEEKEADYHLVERSYGVLYPFGPTSQRGSERQDQCFLQERDFENRPSKIRRGQEEGNQDQN